MNLDSIKISAIPAFSDNYIWLIRGAGRSCAIIDPGDHRPVLETLAEQDLDLQYILLQAPSVYITTRVMRRPACSVPRVRQTQRRLPAAD